MKVKLVILLSFLSVTVGCAQKTIDRNTSPSSELPSDPSVSPDDVEVKVSFALLEADEIQCSSGGTLIATFEDANANNLLDEGENIISSSVTCNGVDGSDGIGVGIQVSAASSAACSAGGSVMSVFSDINSNSILDADESIQSTTTICNGVSGSDGADGSNGSDGSSSYLSVAAATNAQCPAGGAVYTSSQSGQASPDVTVVCNGESGEDGENGDNASFLMGAVGSMVSGESYSACYHDYLYIPNANDENRGWLTFRHQANGSQDRGIGKTGFQIWNVDIPNFNLASEVGNETFCNMSWNASTRELIYTVQTNRDGLSGESGLIDLN